MKYLDKSFTLPASPTITQEAWDAIWKEPDIVYVCSSTTIQDFEEPGDDNELPPQDLPLDPSTPVRLGLPRGCF